MKFTFFLSLILSLCSCTTSYYLFNVDAPTEVYATQNLSVRVGTIQKGEQVIATKAKGRFRKVEYYTGTNFYSGYMTSKVFPNENVVSTDFHKSFVSAPSSVSSRTSATAVEGRKSSKASLKPTNSSGTVNVKGYYRKNGTYVRPYTRSAPRRK